MVSSNSIASVTTDAIARCLCLGRHHTQDGDAAARIYEFEVY